MDKEPAVKILIQKMINIVNEVNEIQKTEFYALPKDKQMAKAADFELACSNAFIKYNVLMFTSLLDYHCKTDQTRDNNESFIITIKLTVTFIDGENGTFLSGIFIGTGSDPNDKSMYKKFTNTQKYRLMKSCLVSNGNIPDKKIEATTVNRQPVLLIFLKEIAQQGSEIFRAKWKSLSSKQREEMRHHFNALHQLAIKADQSLYENNF